MNLKEFRDMLDNPEKTNEIFNKIDTTKDSIVSKEELMTFFTTLKKSKF
jgi:Ca2+-binding EF-hand superfamily protein